jgi:hypothetical protein
MFLEDEQRAWLVRQLSASLQGLANAGSEQRVLFPEWVSKPTELAMHFDHWLSAVRERNLLEVSTAEGEALAALERKLATMSRDGAEFDADLWTEAAVTDSPHWEEVRRLASAALAAFGWPLERPALGPADNGTAFVP